MTSLTRRANPVPSSRETRDVWPFAPKTLEERLQRIQAIGARINTYIQFMCEAGSLNGTSAEAKERDVAAFYERILRVERELRTIQERLQLA